MLNKRLVNQTKGFTLIEVMVVAAIISLLAAIAIPNYIRYRDKGYCSQAENDADMVARAIADYFGNPYHEDLPVIDDLNIAPVNPDVKITGDPNETIFIVVTDRSGRCPDDYQNADDRWNATANTYSKEMD